MVYSVTRYNLLAEEFFFLSGFREMDDEIFDYEYAEFVNTLLIKLSDLNIF